MKYIKFLLIFFIFISKITLALDYEKAYQLSKESAAQDNDPNSNWWFCAGAKVSNVTSACGETVKNSLPVIIVIDSKGTIIDATYKSTDTKMGECFVKQIVNQKCTAPPKNLKTPFYLNISGLANVYE